MLWPKGRDGIKPAHHHYAAHCTKAAMRLFAYGHAINGQTAKEMAAKDAAPKGPPGCSCP